MDLLRGFVLEDGIYASAFTNRDQEAEIEFREKVARRIYGDFMEEISHHHSFQVMDREVARFLEKLPPNPKIIDVGGCLGWHWRHIRTQRPDASVVIVDFIRKNLLNAKALLGDLIGTQVYLMHGDACQLNFPDDAFDAYWTVQTFNYIPNFTKAVEEARRVLKPGGFFDCYMLNDPAVLKIIYALMGKKFVSKGPLPGGCGQIQRGGPEHFEIIKGVFKGRVARRYSEVTFQPELKFSASGRASSLLGKMDKYLSGTFPLWRPIARQISFHSVKGQR